MPSFKELREKYTPKGKVVFSGKAGGKIAKVAVSIVKEIKGFTVIIDGDKLDTYKTEAEAKKNLKITVNELGGKMK
jgi:hypothetical protein